MEKKNKVDIDVVVKYRVSLSDVMVDDDMAQLMTNNKGTMLNCYDYPDEDELVNWVMDNIREEDACDYHVRITDLTINGEPY